MGRVDGKRAIVTGGASGLGQAMARAFVAEGASVVIADVQREAGLALAGELGDRASYADHDVSEEASWIALYEQVAEQHGGLDILVNNAGIVVTRNIEETSMEEWRRLHAVNTDGVFLGCKHGIPRLAASGGGSIVNVSSVAAMIGTPAFAAYSASKGAVRSLTKTVAAHCRAAGYGIRCNSVHPGGILTPMTSALGPASKEASPLTLKLLTAAMTDAPLGEPEDVAHLALFLACDESRHITGAEFVVDGGQLAS